MPEVIDKNLSKISAIIGIVIVICSAFAVVSGYMKYQKSVDNYSNDIQSLQSSVDELVKSTENVTPVDSNTVVNSVKSVGDKVSVLQNSYRNVSSLSDGEVDEDAISSIDTDMIQYFTDEKVCKSWYDCKSAYIQKGTWKFVTNYDFVGNDVSVLWQFVDAYDYVLAYTTADYHVDTKKFDNVKLYNTLLGDAYVSYVTYENAAQFNPGVYLGTKLVFDVLGGDASMPVEISTEAGTEVGE